MSIQPRIFLSYRDKSEGKEFCNKLYEYLVANPACSQMYGEVFFSPRCAPIDHNFKRDMPEVMKQVEYFVMPLTEKYYDGFWDEKNGCPNKGSTTLIEINAALDANSKFISIAFPGYVHDESLLKKIFGDDNYEKIACSVLKNYDPDHEKELLREIGDSMIRDDFNVVGMRELIKTESPNVFLSFKRDTENRTKFPFYQKLYDVKKITLLNFAASSFLSGIDIASIYKELDFLKSWFSYNLINGYIEADVVLTDPHSSAANDAALYKMYPVGVKTKKDKIILHNLNVLYQFMEKHPEANLNIYLTQIALPYGVMITEYNCEENNHMKIDLYSAVTENDKKRPSFYLLQKREETHELYDFFESNVRSIMNNYSYRFDGHPDISWLLKKPIIHRGVIKPGIIPHTKQAYEACIEENCPVEVDLMQMKDETIIVARDDHDISDYGFSNRLSELTIKDLRRINRNSNQNIIFTLEDFLAFVNWRIPVLLEIKNTSKNHTPPQKKYIDRIVQIIHRYLKCCSNGFSNTQDGDRWQGIAIHSSDPTVLRMIKDADCMIPCGIITKDFSSLKSEVGNEFYELHETAGYTKIIKPDFISCDVNYLENKLAVDLCDELNIPLLAWTIKNQEDQELAKDYHCDNIIIEGAKTYI